MKKLAFTALVMFGAVSTAYAAGDAAAGKAKVDAMCASCHGATGNVTTSPAYPKLAGQHASYLAKQLTDFKSGTRQDPIMFGMASALSDEDVANVAAYFSAQTGSVGSAGDANAEKVATGKAIYEAGDKSKGLAACMACHGPSGAGNPGGFPALSGQNAGYVEKALTDFRKGTRTNDLNSMMRDVAAKMSDSDIEAVAAYINALN